MDELQSRVPRWARLANDYCLLVFKDFATPCHSDSDFEASPPAAAEPAAAHAASAAKPAKVQAPEQHFLGK